MGFKYSIDAFTLLLGVAVLAFVSFRVGEVVGAVGNIKVATEYDGFVCLKLLHIGKECWVPLLMAQFEPA